MASAPPLSSPRTTTDTVAAGTLAPGAPNREAPNREAPNREAPERGAPQPTSRSRRIRSWLAALLLPGPVSHHSNSQWTVAVLSGLGASAALLFRLFLPTVVGMADQGDGQQLLCRLGVANHAPFRLSTFTQHIFTSWTPHQWYGETCPGASSGTSFLSSQTLLLWPAKWITPLFGWGAGLDTRAVGILCAVVFGILLAFFVALLPGRAGFRVLMAVAVTAVMSDGVFADFFISPYTEPACFLGVFAVLVALMFLWRRDGVTWLGILVATVAFALAITADPRMLSLLPVAVGALLWRGYRSRRDPAHVSRPRPFRRALVLRIPALVAVAALLGISGFFAASQPSATTQASLYNAVFVEMLPHSSDPKADLRWLGLPTSFAQSSNTTMESPNAAITNPQFPEFARRVTVPKLALFYVTHPDRIVSMADRGLDALTHPVLDSLGSYTAGAAHRAGAKEHRFPVIEGVSVVFAAVPLLLLVLQLVTFVLGIAVASRRRLRAARTAFGAASAFFVAALWFQFWTVMLTGGEPQIDRAMIVTTFMSSLCLVLLPGLIMLLWPAGAPSQRALAVPELPAGVPDGR
jgi:hypothetical protein